MKTINPYLGFEGNCREAMTFYQSCFGGELTFQTFGESPMASQCPAGKEGHILHSSLTGDNFLFMATDMTPPDGFKAGSDISLAISFDSESDIRKVYELLRKQGKKIDDLKDSFWGSVFGVVQDKFGKIWMLDYEKKNKKEKYPNHLNKLKMLPLKKPIVPCLWFDQEAEEAVSFYSELFGNSAIHHLSRYGKEGTEHHKKPPGSAMAVSFSLHGQEFLALNGGPMYRHSPGISFYVTCETLEEADKVWKALAEGGTVLMPYDQYPWSEKYGWLNDRFGLSWQISLGKISDVKQKFVPSLMFVGQKFGKVEAAINFYLEIFQPASLKGIARYEEQDPDETGKVKHAQFYLGGNTFMMMESSLAHQFDITPAVSFIITCETQEEIDYYWDKLTRGEGDEVQCGWLYDQYGVSWQVVPSLLIEGMKDPEKAPKLTAAFMPMKKLEISVLEKAIEK